MKCALTKEVIITAVMEVTELLCVKKFCSHLCATFPSLALGPEPSMVSFEWLEKVLSNLAGAFGYQPYCVTGFLKTYRSV